MTFQLRVPGIIAEFARAQPLLYSSSSAMADKAPREMLTRSGAQTFSSGAGFCWGCWKRLCAVGAFHGDLKIFKYIRLAL